MKIHRMEQIITEDGRMVPKIIRTCVHCKLRTQIPKVCLTHCLMLSTSERSTYANKFNILTTLVQEEV